MNRIYTLCRRLFSAGLILLSLQASAIADGDPVVKTNVLMGNANQISVDSAVTVSDSSVIGSGYTSINKLSLMIDEGNRSVISGAFSASVTLHIKATQSNNSITEYDTTLTVNYTTSGVYAREHAFYFNNAYRVEAKVTGRNTNASWDVWSLLKVSNEISSNPFYAFSCTSARIDTVTGESLAANTVADQLNVSWPFRAMADEYDLEWTYIDSSAMASGTYGSSGNYNITKIFDNNASRVTVRATSYKIPLLYDNKGILFFRARSAQLKTNGSGRMESPWSTAQTSIGAFSFNGHERQLNWQATTTFAEEGKRKTVVQYYDGSLRSRQTVTKDNSTDSTIVAETFYDQQGRPAVQVLPSPSLSNIIQYNQQFNTGLNGGEYTIGQYDEVGDSTYCNTSAQPMGNLSGASQYYSPNNPRKNTGIHRFIPDAQNHPFTETEYTRDNTGRISRQSGVGADHQIGSGHETVYHYGTPSQEELDALFGTEVGDRTHYFKNMTRDANGQYSVSYVDMHGRTIATGLSGKPTAALDTLASYIDQEITETLADSAANVTSGLVMESKKGILVPKPGNYTFDYHLDPSSITLPSCASSICYDCLYDLHITISGGCDNAAFGGQPFDTVFSNFSLATIDEIGNADGFNISFSKYLTEGSYDITKDLSVSRYALDYYKDSIFAVRNLCKSMEHFVDEQRTIQAGSGSCSPDCASCTASIGSWDDFRNNYLQKAGIQTDTAAYTGQAWSAYQGALENCNLLCDSLGNEVDEIQSLMLEDVSPASGQYTAKTGDANSIFAHDDLNNAIPAPYTALQYYDEEGKPDMVYDEASNTWVAPGTLTADVFSNKFKSSWAASLLPLHPEYCRLQKYTELKASFAWDRRFAAVDTYADALAKGYLNPINSNAYPQFSRFGYWSGNNHPDRDPLSVFAGHDYLSELVSQLHSYGDNTSNPDHVNLYNFVTLVVMCDGQNNSSCYATYNQDANAFNTSLSCGADLDQEWRMFRDLYLQIKKKLIAAQLASCGTVPTGHTPRFGGAVQLLLDNGITVPTSASEAENLRQANLVSAGNFYDSSCYAYSAQWLDALQDCHFEPGTIRDEVIAQLVQVCREGADESHPFGSSTIAPGSTYQYSSFEEVIDHYRQTHASVATAGCSADNIRAPRPYNQQTIYTRKPIWTKPDACECGKVTSLHAQYQQQVSQYTSFSQFMQLKYHTTISETVLNQLISLCSTSSGSTCTYLTTAIELPAAFQCHSGSGCASCTVVDSLFERFKSRYAVVPVKYPATPEQTAGNRLFENYMNNRVGQFQTAGDYLDFRDNCIEYAKKASKTIVDSLQDEVSAFDVSGYNCTAIRTRLQCNSLEPTGIFDRSRIVRNGIMMWPDSIQAMDDLVYSQHINEVLNGPGFCLDPGFTFEVRQKSLRDNLSPNGDDVMYVNAVAFTYKVRVFRNNPNSPYEGFYMDAISINIDGHLTPMPDYPILLDANPNAFLNWYTIKVIMTRTSVKFYYNGVLKVEYVRPDRPITNSTVWFGSWYGFQGAVDYGKIWDANGQLRYFDDYNSQPTIVDTNYLCPQPTFSCKEYFRMYYNERHGTYYSYDQIDAIWVSKTGRHPNICEIRDTVSCETHKQYIADFQTQHLSDTLGATHCQTAFANYYNNQRGTNYSFAQIDSINYGTCNGHISVCPLVVDDRDAPLLCGSTASADDGGILIPPVDLEQALVTNCTDSAFLIYSNATELYHAYRDSVLGEFDHQYKQKCLDAYKLESFSVTHQQSEFHYTLYYYDQAGNLVKTVAPKGAQPNWDPAWSVGVKTARRHSTILTPAHTEPTQYRYNTLGQVSRQQTPDGGQSRFWYDRLGRLALSQNARQAAGATEDQRFYSYTTYDELGRITEVGQINNHSATAINDNLSRNPTTLGNWFTGNASYAGQITRTVYDQPYGLFQSTDDRLVVQQRNVRNRVSYTMVRDTAVSAAFNQATFYSYDIHGNVDTLLQDYGVPSVYANVMNQNGNRYKKISYNYDLISGKVNEVAYQRGWSDQFFHRYSYDAENRLILTETSVDDKTWERDARYDYYRHGPLARMVLGDQQVQGVDYAYTLQGWLSGMNSTMGDSANDMGGDGLSGGIHQYTARDVTSLHLSYYTGDYVPITANVSPFPAAMGYQNPSDYRPLYNGNIQSMAVNNRGLQGSGNTGGPLMLYTYRYDQLNRLLGATANNKAIDGTNNWSGLTTLAAYREDLQYDGNGNILGYARNGNKTDPMMDSLNYHYVNGTNRLDWVSDSIAANRYGGMNEIADIDNQSSGNYGYDAIGNLVRDDAEGITNIKWTVYGKIAEIDKTANANQPITRINYSYDAQGNRTGSITEQNDGTKKYTWYVRDAQGNVLATYGAQGPGTELSSLNLNLTERHLYGSSALGMYTGAVNVDNGAAAMTDSNGIQYYRGYRQYALSNHLGNVLSTVSDRKTGTDRNGDGQIDYYDADIRTAQDYYAFGMTMPGRNYTAPNASAYRYGFNGKENDNEVKGTGNQQDYGMRIYDPRLGKFLSVDPLTKTYPSLTPFQFASNSPISNIDLDGGEAKYYELYFEQLYNAKGKLIFSTSHQIENKSKETSDFVNGLKKLIIGEARTGTAYGITLKTTKYDDKGKLATTVTNIGEVYIPGEYDKTKGGFYLTSAKGGYGHQNGNIDYGSGTPISIDILSDAAGFPTNGGDVKNISKLKEILTSSEQTERFAKVIEAAKSIIEGGDRINKLKLSANEIKEKLAESEKLNVPLLEPVNTDSGICPVCKTYSDSGHINGVVREVNNKRIENEKKGK